MQRNLQHLHCAILLASACWAGLAFSAGVQLKQKKQENVKAAPFDIDLARSIVIYQAAQMLQYQ